MNASIIKVQWCNRCYSLLTLNAGLSLVTVFLHCGIATFTQAKDQSTSTTDNILSAHLVWTRNIHQITEAKCLKMRFSHSQSTCGSFRGTVFFTAPSSLMRKKWKAFQMTQQLQCHWILTSHGGDTQCAERETVTINFIIKQGRSNGVNQSYSTTTITADGKPQTTTHHTVLDCPLHVVIWSVNISGQRQNPRMTLVSPRHQHSL